ncbi:cupin domain-containing protein [Pseudochelatococcus lubricantis]|uniref:cupin domain-containing protein n=1 Tax=Pseudochelatococcus lubricantis TaxID=1538102 RepID=UPI0035EB0813
MSLLVSIDPDNLGEAKETKAAPDRLLAGDPSFRTWELDDSRGGEVSTGIWEATPGTTRSIKGETFEFCHILSGVVEITPEGGAPVVYRAGDSFVMKPGLVSTWRTIETVRKIFVVVG